MKNTLKPMKVYYISGVKKRAPYTDIHSTAKCVIDSLNVLFLVYFDFIFQRLTDYVNLVNLCLLS